MSNTRNALLSQLLPYDTAIKKNGSLQTSLKEYQSILRAFLDANIALQNRELEKFDSLVGENACEIRAVWMASNFSKCTVNVNTLIDLITTALTKIDVLLSPRSIALLMRSDESLKTVLENEKLDISLTAEEMFATKSFLLSEMKTVKDAGEQVTSIFRIESTDPKKFKHFGDVSISFARHLLSRTRRSLATSSVQFIRSIASASQDPTLIKMVSERYTVEQNTLPCTPMFWTYKTVFQAAQEKGIPLIIHVKFLQDNADGYTVVDEECLFFKRTPDGSYFHSEPTATELNQPAWVVQGVATADKRGLLLTKEEWIAEITKQPITDVILAGAADHRQYPDPALDALIDGEKDSEYESYKALAKREGFSSENPTTFFIQHVYAARAGNLLEQVQNVPQPASDYHLSRYRKLIENELIGDTREIWETHLNSANKTLFFCRSVIRAVDACLANDYHAFDAHTTANCCHGISLLVRDLILASTELDLQEIKTASEQKIQELEKGLISEFTGFILSVPQQILALTSLYILAFVRDIDDQKRMRTEARKLRTISQVGVAFCWDIANALKLHFSNLVANSYRLYARRVPPTTNINGAPISQWSSYVDPHHIRVDKRGIHYASCIYSNQVSLAYLTFSKAKVALVNDVIDSSGEVVDRFVYLFKGDGHSKLMPLSNQEMDQLGALEEKEPVIVFGGYVRSDSLNAKALSMQMNTWQNHVPRLIMACDIFYPQFPQVMDDPDFNHAPIQPFEDSLKNLFLSHSMVKGVSASDPSLYCLSHTYTASLGGVIKAAREKNASALPSCFHGLQIPHSAMWGVEMREALAAQEHLTAVF